MELYDLENDMGETQDIGSEYPQVVNELKILAEEARSKLGDKLTNRTGIEAFNSICGSKPPEKINHCAVGKLMILKNHAHEKYPG